MQAAQRKGPVVWDSGMVPVPVQAELQAGAQALRDFGMLLQPMSTPTAGQQVVLLEASSSIARPVPLSANMQ